MKLHILIFTNSGKMGPVIQENVDLLIEATKKRNHTLEIISSKDCQIEINKKPQILIENKKPKDIKMLIIKANFRGKDLNTHIALLKQFELSNVPVINGYSAIFKAKNKIRTLQVLNQHNVPTPKTYVIRSSEYIDDVIKSIGTFPIILKAIGGSQGAGVSIVESKRGLRSIIEMIIEDDSSAPLMIQEYIKESTGKDIRVFVVGGKIIAAMERIAKKRGEFRSNFKLGGKVRIAELSKEERRISLKATRVCGLEFAGVDLIRTKNGPKIIEVNANPGLAGITQATEKDIAGSIIDYAIKKVKNGKKKNSV